MCRLVALNIHSYMCTVLYTQQLNDKLDLSYSHRTSNVYWTWQSSSLHFDSLQITASAGQTLLNLDVSNCLSLTDQCCTSIAHNCKILEVLGLTNLKEIKGDDLCRFFHNEERAKQFRAIMLSGSKNVRQSSCILNSWFSQDDHAGFNGGQA